MNLIKIEYVGFEDLQRLWAMASEVVTEEVLRAVTEADALLEHEIKALAPDGASGGGASGLKGSIIGVEQVGDQNVIGMVSASINYAIPVELGTRPHFIGKTGIDSLVDWVLVKFPGSNEEAARNIAFAIATNIAKRGTKGSHMFQRGFDMNRQQVMDMFDNAMERIVLRLGGASY